MLEKMHGTSFDWLTWSAGGLTCLGLANRFEIFKSNLPTIKKYAIGYCLGNEVICRPKKNEVAIMFLKDDVYFWTHITAKEFQLLNGE